MKQTQQIFFLKNKLKKYTKGYTGATGRNNKGRVTAWHRGGKHQQLYRTIDLYRKNTHGIVIGLEYDPNRKCFLARIFNPDTNQNNYILAPTKLKRGDIIRSDSEQNINGHSQKLRYIPTGSFIHNLSLSPGQKGKIIRSPGSFGRLIKKTDLMAQIRLKSGKYHWFSIDTLASLGVVSNSDHKFIKLKKAGQNRWRGKRPIVRGVAMNPIDHPHGGGEGKSSGGRPSVTPWGKPTKGKPTKINK